MDFINVVSSSFVELYVNSSDEGCDDYEEVEDKLLNFAEEIVPTYSNQHFKEHFRLDVETFNKLCKLMHDMNTNTRNLHAGRFEMPIEKQVMIALWFFGNRETFRTISNRFGCAKSTVWNIVNQVSRKLLQLNVEKGIVKWPTNEEKAVTKAYYLQKYRFNGIIGAIDGTEIPIIAPHDHSNSYINRKGFHSIKLQAICDQNLKFTSFYAGEVGSVHDARVLQRSNLENNIHSGVCAMRESEHILGDSAYPLKTWLITPHKNNEFLSEAEVIFNTVHSKCRIMIERAFGMLKGCSRRLKYIESKKTWLIPMYIAACCILHNFCINSNDILPNDIDSEDTNDEEGEFVVEDDGSFEGDGATPAQRKRSQITDSLF